MKTYLYLFQDSYSAFEGIVPERGYVIGYNLGECCFKHFWSLPATSPLFRWRRGLPAGQINSPGLFRKLEKQRIASFIEIRSSDFRKILYFLRRIQLTQQKTVIIDITSNEINSSFVLGNTASFMQNLYPSLLTKNIEADHLQDKNLGQDRGGEAAIRKAVQQWKRQDKINVNALGLWKAVNFCQYFSLNPEITEIQFPRERKVSFFDWKRPLRDILVISNLSGPFLHGLSEKPENWSSAPQGIHVRHIFGPLKNDRCERIISENNWDCIIYRGHSEIKKGSLSYLLADGSLYPVHNLPTRLYIHLGCIPLSKMNDIKCLPAALSLVPFQLLPDQNDSRVASDIFESLISFKTKDNLIKALKKFNERFFYVCS